MTQKEQILALLSQKDLATLQKVEKYTNLLLIPEEDLCVNVTMTQMVEKAHQLADRHFPEWTDRSKSDFGEFIIELIALFSEKDFWYINALANESILKNSRSYSNIFLKAAQLGYNPVLGKGARALFTLNIDSGGAFNYGVNSVIVNVGGKEYLNSEPFSVATTSATTATVPFIEGTYRKEDVLFNGYNILISKRNVDLDSIKVLINGVEFTRVGNFGESASDSNHFVVLPEDSGYVSMYFGSDGYGVSVDVGTPIHIEYVETSGKYTNVGGDVVVRVSPSLREVTGATYLVSISEGTEMEDATSIKEKAPIYFGHRNSAINTSSAEQILRSYDFVAKSKVNVFYRTVEYRCIPKDGSLDLSADQVNYLTGAFHRLLMLGYSGIYRANSYIDLIAESGTTSISLEVYISRGYDTTVVGEVIRQVLVDNTSPLILAEYGGGFSKSTIDAQVKSKGYGVQNIIWRKADNSILPDLPIGEYEIFQPIDLAKVNIRVYVS